jgi:glycosyltransferase involved in cell wall biosynthesis
MTAPIRVAYLSLSSQAGGAERQMLTLAERLPRDRFAPELIVGTDVGSHVARARRAAIPVHVIDGQADSLDRSIVDVVRSRATKAARLIRIVRAARYDVIDAWLYPADAAVALARPLVRSPLVISGRRNTGAHDRFGRFEPVIETIANRLTDVVVANSAAAAAHAVATQRVDPARVRIIRNGVVIPAPVAVAERAARRHELGAHEGDVVIGCVASYTPAKRLDVLVESFSIIARTDPAIRLELIGEGAGRASIEAQVRALGLEDRVCVHGYEGAPERFYAAFDVVALSSDREGLPNALLEAGAAGCAIVSTAAGGAGEIVLDDETGLLVPVGDVNALAAALACLVREPELRERLGRAAREHIARTFGMDRFIAEFAALYEERVEIRRRRAGHRRLPGA